jgi:hypothetical protein
MEVFDFIHRAGVREDVEEEQIRKDMRKLVHWGVALLLFDCYRHCIQLKNGKARERTPDRPDENIGLALIKANYISYTHYGPTEGVVREFAKLPAAPNFSSKKQSRLSRAASREAALLYIVQLQMFSNNTISSKT